MSMPRSSQREARAVQLATALQTVPQARSAKQGDNRGLFAADAALRRRQATIARHVAPSGDEIEEFIQ
jgi:hypothetical protein